jgi:hypothetical protein
MRGVRWAASLLTSLVFLTAGCSGGDAGDREAVSGTVNFRKQPLKSGTITFDPISPAQSRGGAIITDGRFSIPKKDGLLPGRYKVRIRSGSSGGDPGDAPAGEPPKETKEQIPADWNEATKQEVEIKKGGPNEFTFNIP